MSMTSGFTGRKGGNVSIKKINFKGPVFIKSAGSKFFANGFSIGPENML